MGPVPASVVRQAEQLRFNGNEYYKKGRIGAAIDAYTESLVLFPSVAACYTNRAQCFRKKKEWGRVEEDCKKAISLDPNSVKGHFLLGLAHIEKYEYRGGIMELEKAFQLARGLNPGSYLVEEIWQNLARAKYSKWLLESNKRLLDLQELKQACLDALSEKFSRGGDSSEAALKAHREQLDSLSGMLDMAAKADKQDEVPDYLCCKITLDIYRDPVITPSGITYERAVLLDHLRKVGHFDPVTRETLEEHQLVPNLAMREAVQAYLDEHGWAYQTVDSPPIIID